MSTLKVNAIRQTTATSDAVTLASDGTCTVKATNNLSNRRLNDNGNMRIAQRGTSATAEGYGTLDRISFHHGGEDEDGTQSQHVLTSSDTGPWEKGFRYSYHLQNGNQTGGGDAGDFCYIRSRIEAQDMATCGWEYTSASSYITLSFWVKSSVAQNFYGFIQTHDGTGQSYPFETGSLSVNTWTKVTKKIPGNSNIQFDNNSELGLQIVFSMFWGADYTNNSKSLNQWIAYDSNARTPDDTSTWWTTNDATWEITGLQLEVGDVATDFEHRSYNDELVKCQRYYYVHAYGDNDPVCNSNNYNATSAFGVIHFPVTMRAEPSLDSAEGTNYFQCFGNGGSDTFDSVTFQVKSENGAALEFYGNLSVSQGHGSWIETNNAAAKIAFSSEL